MDSLSYLSIFVILSVAKNLIHLKVAHRSLIEHSSLRSE
jgi:hypothetical protein